MGVYRLQNRGGVLRLVLPGARTVKCPSLVLSRFNLCLFSFRVLFCRHSLRLHMVPPGRCRDIQRSRGSKRAPVGSSSSKWHWMGQWIQKPAGNHLSQWGLFWVVLVSMTVLPVIAPRDSAPNRDDNYHVLHGVTEWNGVPRRDFRRIWFAALIVALGAIFQDGWTLLQTARDQDAGGPLVVQVTLE